jgi:hypothetical protein
MLPQNLLELRVNAKMAAIPSIKLTEGCAVAMGVWHSSTHDFDSMAEENRNTKSPIEFVVYRIFRSSNLLVPS